MLISSLVKISAGLALKKDRKNFGKKINRNQFCADGSIAYPMEVDTPPIPSHMGNPNLQPPIERHHDAAGLFNQNILNRGKREHRPSFYKRTPYMEQPPTTILPKKCGNKNKNNVTKANLSPLNLGNAFDDENEGGDDVIFLGGEFTGNYLVVIHFITFWQQLIPHLCMPDIDSSTPTGWLSGEHMNAWMELLIRYRTNTDPWTVAYTNTISVHPENQCFLIEMNQHTIGILDGLTRPYPPWSVVNWVFLPILVGGNHWVTGVIDLPHSHVYVFDSLPNEGRKNLLWNQIQRWTPVVNNILQRRGPSTNQLLRLWSHHMLVNLLYEDTRDCGYD
ncbi:phospholipase-like protein [Tanacetum coccineum]